MNKTYLSVDKFAGIDSILYIAQAQQFINNHNFTNGISNLDSLIKELGYPFNLDVNLAEDNSIFLVINALAFALFDQDPEGLHNFVWDPAGYDLDLLFTRLATINAEDYNQLIASMLSYICNSDILGAQAWSPDENENNMRHLARILFHLRNTIQIYDQDLTTEIILEGLYNESRYIVEQANELIFDVAIDNFSIFDIKAFKHVRLGGFLNLVSEFYTIAKTKLEIRMPGDGNEVRRLEILNKLLDKLAEKFIPKIENTAAQLADRFNNKVVLEVSGGVPGLGKGTITRTTETIQTLIENKQLKLPPQLETKLLKIFDDAKGGGGSQKVSKKTGTRGMFNPGENSEYAAYRGNTIFANDFVRFGMMLGDKITHLLVMIENCCAMIELINSLGLYEKSNKQITVQIDWDVYPRTAGQSDEQRRFLVDQGAERFSERKKYFLGFTVERLNVHLNNLDYSRAASLHVGVLLNSAKKGVLCDALKSAGVILSPWDLIQNLQGYEDIKEQLNNANDEVEKVRLFKKIDDENFWQALTVAMQSNTMKVKTVLTTFTSYEGFAILTEEVHKELLKPKYRNTRFVLKHDQGIIDLINDFINEIIRSNLQIAGRVGEEKRVDDLYLQSILASRMRSIYLDTYPWMGDDVERYALGYDGGEAYARYVEEQLRRSMPNYTFEDNEWIAFRALLVAIHQRVSIEGQKVDDVLQEA